MSAHCYACPPPSNEAISQLMAFYAIGGLVIFAVGAFCVWLGSREWRWRK